jgi:glyoxylase-like metal-dependent hydrolase (beta-lactamase superfamily II)
MSEPKTVARSVTEIVPGLFHYMIDDERIKTPSHGYALVQNGKLALIDPLPLDPAQIARLGTIETILIGTPSHQRSAWTYRRETHAKVFAPEGWSDLEEKPDGTYREGAALPGGLRPLHAPGPHEAHYAFHLDRKPGVLLCTDLWHVTPRGVEFLPDKYMSDATRARESARRLLEVNFDILCFGHGDPIRKGARKVVADLVGKDAETRKPAGRTEG